MSKVIRPLNNLATSLELDGAAASTALSGTTTNVGLFSTSGAALTNLTGGVTANSLTLISGTGFTNFFGSTGGNYAASGLLQVTLNSGGLLSTGGALGNNVALTSGSTSMDIHVTLGNTLTLADPITGLTGGLIKADGGTLVFNTAQYYTGNNAAAGTVINGGTIQLGATAGTNAILVNPTATIPTVVGLQLDGVGSTFDLNGNSQAVGQIASVVSGLSGGSAVAGAGGKVINTANATNVTLTDVASNSTSFAGSIGGTTGQQNINFVKQGNSTLTLNGSNSYTGTTTIMGGGLTLRDGGALTGTGTIAVNYSSLTLDNGGLAFVTNRIPTGSTVALTGGSLFYAGGQGANTVSVGPVTVGTGANVIQGGLWSGNSSYGGSLVMTLASVAQSNSSGTLNFQSNGGNFGYAVSAVNGFPTGSGAANVQVLINGGYTGTGLANTLNTNGIMGGWATVNGTDWAVYLATTDSATGAHGVGNLGASTTVNGVVQTPYGVYSTNAINTAGTGVPTDNIFANAAATGITARTINSLKVGAFLLTGNGLDQTVSINSGGILTTGAATFQGGRYTAGTAANASMYVYANSGTDVMYSQVVDTIGGGMSLVKSGSAQLSLGVAPIVAVNSSTVSSATAPSIATVPSTAGLVVGELLPAAINNIPANSIITAITSGTQFTVNTTVGTAGATATNGAFTFPTAQVLGTTSGAIPLAVANTPFNVQLPVGSNVLPGTVVTQAVGTGGTAGLFGAGTVTVLSYNSGTGVASLIDTTAGAAASTAATNLVFTPQALQTSASVAGLTAGSNTFTFPANTLGLNVGQLVTVTGGAGTLPANTYITAYNPNIGGGLAQVTLSANALTTGVPTTENFAAPVAASQLTTVNTSNATATVLSSLGMFVGEPVIGTGIPLGTTVTAIVDAQHVTLSSTPTVAGTGNVFFGVAPVGANIAGVSVPSGSGTTLTLTAAQVAGLVAGMSVTGYGMNPGTIISSINGTTVTLNQATASVASGTAATLTFGAPLNSSVNAVAVTGTTTGNNATVTLLSTAGLYPGMAITGPGIPAGDTIATIASATTVTLTTATNPTGFGPGTLSISSPSTLVAFSEGYTGSTVVNQGLLVFGGTTNPAGSGLGSLVIPGNLILNNASATQSTNNGSIANTSNLTINGAGTLTLVGNNTLASATFNGTGGTNAINITGGILTFGSAGVTAINNNLASTPTIASTVELAGANLTLTASGTSPDDLSIGLIQNTMGGTASPAGLIKAGSGSVVLTGANTFTGGVQLNVGSIIAGASTSTTTAGSPMTSAMTGPLGIGTLTLAANTTVLSDGTARTLINPVTDNGNFTFGGLLAGNNLTLNGQVNLGGSTRSITVTSPLVTGTLGGGIITAGNTSPTAGVGLTKLGAGILTLSSSGDNWVGATTVSAGVLKTGAAQILPNSQLVVAAGAEFDINAIAGTELGSLAGDTALTGGLVTNSGASQVLTIGADNTSPTFAGAFTAATLANLGLTKIGTGTETFTNGLSNATGALVVNGGQVLLNGNGAFLFGGAAADTLNSTGTLALDNTATNVPNRLGGSTRNLTIQGGKLSFTGTSVAASNASETIGTLLVQNGGGTITLNAGTVGNTTLTLTTLTAEAINSGGSLLIQGLSTSTGAGNANLLATLTGVTGVTQGSGTTGSNTMPIRPDIIAATSSTGTGDGFLVKDTTSGFLRPMATGELLNTSPLTSSSTTNVGNFASAATYSAATSVNSLTLNTAFAVNTTGGGQAIQGTVAQNYTNAAILNVLTLNTGGLLATTSNTLNVGELTTGLGTVQYEMHVTGSAVLNLNGFLLGTTGGLVKADGGTLNLNNLEYYTGATTVNGGTLNLSGTAHTIQVTPSATVATLQNLVVNGGTLNLNGADQAVGTLSNNNSVGGTGGTIANTPATAATANLTVNFATAAGTQTFGGVISGTGTSAVSLYKDGTGTQVLTGANTYTGSTNILGGVLTLQDSGTLASGTVNINSGTLNLTNNGLSNINARIGTTALVNLNAGSLTVTGANYTSTNITLGSSGNGVTAASGFNTITATAPAATTNNTLALTIANLTRAMGSGAEVSFIGGTTLGQPLPGAAQVFVTNYNGFAPALTSGILGGWATSSGATATADNWATYVGAQTFAAGANGVITTFNSNAVTLAGTSTTANLIVGQQISGQGIPSGSYITAITGPQAFTISQLASATFNPLLILSGTGSAPGSATTVAAGVAALNSQFYLTAGQTNVAAYATLAQITGGTSNVSVNTVTTTGTVQFATAVGNQINSLLIAPGAAGTPTIDLGATTAAGGGLATSGTLQVTTGGIMRTSTVNTTTTFQNGTLTAGTGAAGTAELNFYGNNTSAITLAAGANGLAITDNGSTSVALVVKTGSGGMSITSNTAGVTNTYTGGTVVNGGTLTLNNTIANGTSIVVIPAGAGTNGSGTQTGFSLVVNNGAAVTESVANQIAQTASVLVNGSGTLTLTGANTLSAVTFNNTLGGTAQVNNLAIGTTSLTLTGGNAITASNSNFASTPVISGTGNLLLQATGVNPAITVSGISTDSLIISSPITSVTNSGTATILGVTGGGTLVLSGASTFTGGLQLNGNSSLMLGASSTPTSGTVTSGPVGTGTLSLTGGTSILSDGSAIRTIANATNVSGSFTFGGTVANNGVILSGAMNLGANSPTITVTSPLNISTISGPINSTSTVGVPAFTKAGAGTLLISSGTNSLSTGGVVVTGGVLEVGNVASLTGSNAVQVNAGAVFDTHGMATESIGSLSGGTTTTGGMVTNDTAGTTSVLTIGGDNTSPTFAGIITDTKAGVTGTGNLALTKTGTGNQTLTGANTYAGATTIGGTGILTIQNPNASSTFATLGNTAIAVGSGATFAPTVGSGAPTTVINAGSTAVTLGGASLALNAGSILDMRDSAIGTFNLIEGATFAGSGLTVAATANLYFDIGNVGSTVGADHIVVTKSATVTSGATINLNTITSSTSLPIGVVPLINTGTAGFTGTGTNNFTLANPTITLSGLWGTKVYNLTLSGAQDTTTQTALNITVAAPTNAYWSGAVDGNWNTGSATGVTNWRTDATSNIDTQATPTSASNVFFNTTTPAAANLATNLAAPFSIASLGFTSAATSDVSIGDSGSNTNTLTVGAAGITMNNNTGNDTINANVILGANQTWTNNSTGTNTLTVNGSGTSPSITGSGINLQTAGSGNLKIVAPIQTGAGSLTHSGTGTLTLSGANTFSGPVAVTSGGTLSVSASNNLGDSSATNSLTLSNASTLQVTGSFDLAGTSGNRVLNVGTGGGTLAVTTGNTLTISSAIAGANTLTTSGPGTVLINNNTPGNAPGGITVTGGILGGVGNTFGTAANTILGNVAVNGGTLSPSSGLTGAGVTSSTATLNLGGALNVGSAGTLVFDVTGATTSYDPTTVNFDTLLSSDPAFTGLNGAVNDFINLTTSGITPSFAIGSTIKLVEPVGGYTFKDGDVINILDWNSLIGITNTPNFDFSGLHLTPGTTIDLTQFNATGAIGIAPEPSRVLLLMLGLLGFGLRRRRRR